MSLKGIGGVTPSYKSGNQEQKRREPSKKKKPVTDKVNFKEILKEKLNEDKYNKG